MGQKKKDFTGAAAAAFGGGDLVSRIIATPQPTATAAPMPTGDAQDVTAEDIPDNAALSLLPKQKLLYRSKDGSEVRMTFMVSKEMHEKMRRLCYASNSKQKDVVDAALRLYFAAYEAKHGKL
jgi:hypothetical protein